MNILIVGDRDEKPPPNSEKPPPGILDTDAGGIPSPSSQANQVRRDTSWNSPFRLVHGARLSGCGSHLPLV